MTISTHFPATERVGSHGYGRFRTVGAALALAMTLGITGCATVQDNSPPNPAMAQRGPMGAAELEGHFRAGVSQDQILAALNRRGIAPLKSEEIELLRKAGASHEFINNLLQANEPARWIYIAPPRLSFYYGRAGWYWVDSFGWPLHPQPYYWREPRLIHPVKPTPKPAAQTENKPEAKPADAKPDTTRVKKPVPSEPANPISEKTK